jgi:hypothetical protein
MKKKAVKKLALSKETVRGITDDLRQVRGGSHAYTCDYTAGNHHCDAVDTMHPTCSQ